MGSASQLCDHSLLNLAIQFQFTSLPTLFYQIFCQHVVGESGETVLALPDGFLVPCVLGNDSQDYFFNYLCRDGGCPDCGSSGFSYSPSLFSCPSPETGINTSSCSHFSIQGCLCLFPLLYFWCVFARLTCRWIFSHVSSQYGHFGAEEKVGVAQSRISN